MRKIFHFLPLPIGILLSLSALAETVTIPRAANVRSSPTFYGRENILAQLPQDAQVEVISRRSLASGADALEIKIISPAAKIFLNKQNPIYIWQSKTEIENQAFKTQAGVTCANCNTNTSNTPSPTNDIVNIINKIEEQQSEEILTTAPHTGSLANAIKTYSESEQVKKSYEWAKSHKQRGDGKCYRHTKEALATQSKQSKGSGNNLIPKWYSSVKAKYGVKDLKQQGFVNLLEQDDYKDMTSHTAPHGAVLIYKHINRQGAEDRKAGHAEIKFDDTVDGRPVQRYFYGPLHDYPVNNRDGSRYQLIGIMIKSPLEESTKKK